MRWLNYWVQQLGVLRVLLLVCVALALVFAPAPGTPAQYTGGWQLTRTVLIPVLAPMLLMLLLLDALMSRIFMSDAEYHARRRLRTVMLVNLALALALLLYWLPYYAALRP